jgi:hypothetical protein
MDGESHIMNDPVKLRDLSEKGTRYEHWQELRDLFLLGASALEKINKRYWTDKDYIHYGALRLAEELIQKQIELAGRHDYVSYDTQRQVEVASKMARLGTKDTPVEPLSGENPKS